MKMIKTKLAKAVAIAATGAALSLGVSSTASAHVMYNTYNMDGLKGGTDGWTHESQKTGAAVPWLGTAGGVNPFGFAGIQALNWAVAIHDANSSHEVSQAAAITAYGASATVDLDTVDGAWGSWPVDENNPNSGRRGWAHHVDYGLIKSDIETDIVIDVSSLNGIIDNFGITVFTGMDDGTAGYNHHAEWNTDYLSGVYEAPAIADDPHGTNGVAYLTHGDSSTVTFHAMADQVYSIYFGGNEVGGQNFGDLDGYVLNVSTVSAVPVPAAAWLFGTGLMGLVSLGRRKQKA